MISKPKMGRPFGTSSRSHQRWQPQSLQMEPLEQRQMLDAAFINEIYLDPPSGGDTNHEYIELRGTPGMSLDNHYLVIVENENTPQNDGGAGEIDKVFSLHGESMGSNGFLTFRKAGNNYTVAPDTTDLIFSGEIENSGFTAMLIVTDGTPGMVPTVGFDLDVGNNGLDDPNGRAGWTILDSIGIHSETGEAFYGRLYGEINFGPEASTSIEPGKTYVGLGYEIEYIGRWGNSTGSTADDWHISNLTDNPLSGFQNQGDYRQSADPHGSANVESNKEVPYGTNLTDTLGAPNLVSTTEVFINEIYLDPPSGGDTIYEYIELRGPASMSLDGYRLIFLENENDILNEGGAGEIEQVFNLDGYSLGSNGYLVIQQSGGYNYTVAPDTTIITANFVLENSGFTAMLIKNNGGAESEPVFDDINPVDLDENNDGLDVASGHINWDIKDSIGLHSEADEPPYGVLYGMVNFGPGPNGVPIANYYNVGFEIEYVGRWGNSTGFDEPDWHISNLTDNPLSGFQNQGDFRQSAEPHGSANVESNKGVAYGTNLTNTIGADNYPLNAPPPASVVDRHIFYNQSFFDSNSAGVHPNDDNAIAPDKDPYFAGDGVVPLSAITSYTRGINGIMVDIEDAAGTITAADFTFKMGANNAPSTWVAAPAPASVTVRPGEGVGGSDRVQIIWNAGVIVNTYLEITVEGNDAAGGFNTNTGLATSDVFYFGNRVADTQIGSPAGAVLTNVQDEIAARLNPGALVGITSPYDFDKSNTVNTADQIAARLNAGFLTRLNIAAPATALAAAADDAPDSANAIASALAATPSRERLPKFGAVAEQFRSFELNARAVAKVISQLADNDRFRSRFASSIERAGEALGIDDDVIDSLLDEIGLG